MLKLFYGGTFDPVHNGHLAIARAARDELGTTVHLMPAADPAHRAPPGADAGQRAEMLELAISNEPGLVVDRRELDREGRTYSIDTLRELRTSLGPDVPIALLIGADSFIGLPSWREWRELFDFTHFVVAPRPRNRLDGQLPHELAAMAEGRWAGSPVILETMPAGRLFLLHQPLQPESASEVRRRIAQGQDWLDLVPEAVARFILGHGLYRRPAAKAGPP